jgi:hypothetical protein
MIYANTSVKDNLSSRSGILVSVNNSGFVLSKMLSDDSIYPDTNASDGIYSGYLDGIPAGVYTLSFALNVTIINSTYQHKLQYNIGIVPIPDLAILNTSYNVIAHIFHASLFNNGSSDVKDKFNVSLFCNIGYDSSEVARQSFGSLNVGELKII